MINVINPANAGIWMKPRYNRILYHIHKNLLSVSECIISL